MSKVLNPKTKALGVNRRVGLGRRRTCLVCRLDKTINRYPLAERNILGRALVCLGCVRTLGKRYQATPHYAEGSPMPGVPLYAEYTLRCPRCRKDLHIHDFLKEAGSPTSFDHYCRVCRRASNAEARERAAASGRKPKPPRKLGKVEERLKNKYNSGDAVAELQALWMFGKAR